MIGDPHLVGILSDVSQDTWLHVQVADGVAQSLDDDLDIRSQTVKLDTPLFARVSDLVCVLCIAVTNDDGLHGFSLRQVRFTM